MRVPCARVIATLFALVALPASAAAQTEATELAPVTLTPDVASLAPLTVESRGVPLVLRFPIGEAPVVLTRDPRLPEGHCTTPCALRVVPGTVHIVGQNAVAADVTAAVDVPPNGLRIVLRPETRAHRGTRLVFMLGGAATSVTGLVVAFGGLGWWFSDCRSGPTRNCTSDYWSFIGGPGLLAFGFGLAAIAVGTVSASSGGAAEIHPPTFVWDLVPVPGGAVARIAAQF